jgi:hypothetical protein
VLLPVEAVLTELWWRSRVWLLPSPHSPCRSSCNFCYCLVLETLVKFVLIDHRNGCLSFFCPCLIIEKKLWIVSCDLVFSSSWNGNTRCLSVFVLVYRKNCGLCRDFCPCLSPEKKMFVVSCILCKIDYSNYLLFYNCRETQGNFVIIFWSSFGYRKYVQL